MSGDPLWRRKLLIGGFAGGLAGLSGCLGQQEPEATHWAAGIRWGDPPKEVFEERGFLSQHGSLSGPSNATDYLRVDGGELTQLYFTPSYPDSVPADRGDHIEYVVDFEATFQGKETVFEYTIPDENDLVGVLAGFAECRHYQGTDEWVVRPLNADLGTDFFGRQQETLLVRVSREINDESRDWFVWGHTESTREWFRDRADGEHIEFLDPGETATFSPASYYKIRMEIADGTEQVARVNFPEPDADP